MSSNFDQLISHVKDKEVCIVCHYDADGVTSGALLFHLLKPHVKTLTTASKGVVFRVRPCDVVGEPDVVICADIQPDPTLVEKGNVIYVDHHPYSPELKFDKLLFSVYDSTEQSCSLVVWRNLMPETNNAYFVFLALLGYFGDGGKPDEIPLELQMRADTLLKSPTRFGVHDLMERKQSRFSDGDYLEIQRYVSALNTGKRMHWNGNIPLELLKNIHDFRPFIYNLHPIAEQLSEYKRELRGYYNMKVDLKDTGDIQYAVINCERNVQGVLCARCMKDKPILIINRYEDTMIASMRVPDHITFDAGKYLSGFMDHIPSVTGGGHEKAGGVTFHPDDMEQFMALIEGGTLVSSTQKEYVPLC